MGKGKDAPDQEQRDLIASALDTNLFVEAAAGTGKTTCLVARMVNLVRAGPCTIDQLAAVTYTRKAAAELRARFQVALEKAARDATGGARERLGAAVKNVERCYLGTIHAFCARLLRERPVEAGVDPSFRELDEAADSLLRRRAWDDHIAHLIAAGDPLVAELDNLGVELGLLGPTFERFADYPDVAEWPAPAAALPDPQPIRAALETYAHRMEDLAESFPDDAGRDKLMPRYRLVPRLVRQSDLQRPAELMEVLEQFSELKSTDIVQKNWPGKGSQAKAEWDAWNDFARDHAWGYVAACRMARYGPVLRTLLPALDQYQRLRRDAGGLNFQDLLLGAARLLREFPHIRRYFRGRFTHLLVDEFQDTDPIQAEVMMLLTADELTQKNWRRCRPERGSLFVVGDPKQSIYRFRRADIVTYNEVRQIIEANGGQVVSLTANFRTIPSVIGWVNQAFSKQFPATQTEFAPRRCPLEVGRTGDPAGDLAGVRCLTIPGRNKGEVLAYEADFLARTIRHALDTGLHVPRSATETGAGAAPDAGAGDFLIVTRNTHNLSLYARKLQELGVPHQVTGGTALNESEELYLLYTCLRAVVRPDDPVALVAALRSELFGVSDQALFAFKQAGGTFGFRGAVPAARLSAADAEAVQDAFDRLKRYDVWLKELPRAATFERVAGDLGLPARACAEPGGDVRAGTLAKALQLVEVVGREMDSVADLVEYLGQLVEQSEKHDGISVRPNEKPVVRLMNLHKVKGLEAPVVFLADPTGEWDHDVGLHIDRSGDTVRGYLAIYAPSRGHQPARLLACPADWDRLAYKEKQFQEAENTRLLYVAATRAGASLTIAQREERNQGNPWQYFADHLSGCQAPQDPGPQTAPSCPPLSVTPQDVSAAAAAMAQRWEAMLRPTYHSGAMKEIALMTSPLPALERAYAPAGEHGVEWGTLIHALLEATARAPAANLHALARAISRNQDISLELLDAAVETVQVVQRSDLWRRAEASSRRLVEVPIQRLVPAAEPTGLPTIQRGVIDLLFLEPPGWVIVDYKTDNVAPQALANLVAHYRPQVCSYSEAWQQVARQPVSEVGLFFTRTNKYVQVL